MIQALVTAVIVFVACIWAAKLLYKGLKSPKKSDCDGCNSECGGCGIDPELKKKIKDAVEAKKM